VHKPKKKKSQLEKPNGNPPIPKKQKDEVDEEIREQL